MYSVLIKLSDEHPNILCYRVSTCRVGSRNIAILRPVFISPGLLSLVVLRLLNTQFTLY